jgi:hypothetical protein
MRPDRPAAATVRVDPARSVPPGVSGAVSCNSVLARMSEWVSLSPPSFVAATAELASIADAREALARPSTVGHIIPATGAPQRPDATADGGGACTGPRPAILAYFAVSENSVNLRAG